VAFRQLFSLAAIDPELRAVMQEKDAVRRTLIRALVRGLGQQGRLQGTPQRARDLLLVLTSFDTFETLYLERGSVASASKLLVDVCESLLLRV
jgi:hypothetical protein